MNTPSPNLNTTSDRLSTVLSYGALLLLGYLGFLIVEPFLEPLAWSAVLAIFFFPLHEKVARRLRPKLAALISTIGVTLLLIVPALIVLLYAAREAIDATARLQNTLHNPELAVPVRLMAWVRAHLPAAWHDMDFSEPLRQGGTKIAEFLAGKLGALVKNTFTFLVDLFIVIFALFFMFRDGGAIVGAVRHLIPFEEPIQRDMLTESRELIFASVAVGLLVAVVQGVLGGLAFVLAGIATPVFWGVLIAFFSLVPVVGSALIWVPGSLWLIFSGHWGRGLMVVVICGGVATIADNILRPLLLRNRTRLNELLLFISVLGGIEVFGLLGLVAGPTIVAAAMGVFRVYAGHRDTPEAPVQKKK